ncbi:MAG: ABC transporter ATP-binding protein [Clostridiales bacterium]|jgi:branched-chain amino acid transport system ATP-binding protein|nr:ABC transporter ATP-binding protein [Clostridiales bacterium]
MANALDIKGLTVKYGYVTAVKGIDLEVASGGLVALLGANGAGKSSVLKAISGAVSATGEMRFFGDKIMGLISNKITKKGLLSVPEGRQIFRDLTVEENLRTGAFTVKNKAEIAANFERVYSYFPFLKERGKQIGQTLSGGEQQMLAMGRALMGSPKMLILDEPSLGLAPLIVKQIFEIVEQIRNDGTTVLMVEQNALGALKIADYAYVMELGAVIMQGKAAELIKDPKLIDAYLGKNEEEIK